MEGTSRACAYPSTIGTRPTTDPLSCTDLGYDVSVNCPGVTGPHFSSTVSGVMVAPNDYVQVGLGQADNSEGNSEN